MDIRKIIKEEIGDFEWAKDVGLPAIHVGGKFRTPNGNVGTINKIEGGMVHWFGKDVRDGDTFIASDKIGRVQQRIDDGIWTPVD